MTGTVGEPRRPAGMRESTSRLAEWAGQLATVVVLGSGGMVVGMAVGCPGLVLECPGMMLGSVV